MPVGRCKAPPRRIEAPCMRRVNQPRRCSRILRTFPVRGGAVGKVPARCDDSTLALRARSCSPPTSSATIAASSARPTAAAASWSTGSTRRWSRTTTRARARGVVRGMHFTVGRGAAKLVRCGRGTIFDVLVDLRRGLTHVRGLGGLRAERREHAHPLCPRGVRPWLLRHSARLPTSSTSRTATTTRPPTTRSGTTIPRSASNGRSRSTSCSLPSATSTRRCSGTWRDGLPFEYR